MKLIHDLCDRPQERVPTRRGPAWQWPQRNRQHQVRDRAARLRLALAERGWTEAAAATFLKVSPRTLRDWVHDYRRGIPPTRQLGRPSLRAPVAQRNQVIALIAELGPGVGVPTLQACCPGLSRAELADLLRRYRRLWRLRHYEALHVLRWQVPGAVWAMDLSEPPVPIDGRYPYLLAVRDLASGQQLLWRPLRAANGAEVRLALASLLAVRGAPLVLKTDNGSAFGDDLTLALLHSAGVIPLFSPPYWPRYNGAIEAGIGSLKTRTEDHASRHGHPGSWTWDDLAAAQEQANATARPRGPNCPTPAEAWAGRQPITPEQRVLFQASVQRLREEIRAAEANNPTQPATTTRPASQDQRALDRQAIRRALEEHGYLLYSRRRIPLPIKRRKVAVIT
jgi:hypothetical protein